jgi:glycosyltransferase involved in cell wall biosynthesis
MCASRPLVSIITPSFNQADYLEETIQSVLSQDYERIEYIIIDGGSNDGSIQIIQSYEDELAAWISEPDMGQTDAINKGFAMAKGDILAWLNSDDTYLPGAVSKAVHFLTAHPEVGMMFGKAYYIDENSARVALYPAAPTSLQKLRNGLNTVSQQASFFRRKVWELVGPLDTVFYYAMDYDLWTRISAVTPIAFSPRFMANFRLQGTSKSMTEANRCWPEMVKIHFRDGGKYLSILYLKYVIRRIVEPFMPLRIRYWRVRYWLKNQLGLGSGSSTSI